MTDDDARIEQRATLNADFEVVKDAIKNPHLWIGSEMPFRALARIKNATVLDWSEVAIPVSDDERALDKELEERQP